jgi:hypothetical protein
MGLICGPRAEILSRPLLIHPSIHPSNPITSSYFQDQTPENRLNGWNNVNCETTFFSNIL